MKLKPIDPKDLQINPITMFSQRWPLLTAGNKESGFNTMTIAWGHIGSIWDGLGLPTVSVYVRPQRHTFGFMNQNEMFTVSVLPTAFKEQLTYLGRTSGRDEDKVSKAGLTPAFAHNTTYFSEAEMVFICRKLYQSPLIHESFVDMAVCDRTYPQKDYHTQYIGEIVEILA